MREIPSIGIPAHTETSIPSLHAELLTVTHPFSGVLSHSPACPIRLYLIPGGNLQRQARPILASFSSPCLLRAPSTSSGVEDRLSLLSSLVSAYPLHAKPKGAFRIVVPCSSRNTDRWRSYPPSVLGPSTPPLGACSYCRKSILPTFFLVGIYDYLFFIARCSAALDAVPVLRRVRNTGYFLGES